MAPRKSGNSSVGEPLFSAGGNGARNPGSGFSYYIGDLFSTFSKHISPAFHHERPDRSVQMRLYTMHKGQHLLIFIMFLCLFFIAVLMGLAGPSMTMKFVMPATKIRNQNNTKPTLPGGPFHLLTPDLTSYQQQLWLSAQLVTKVATEQETFTKVCYATLHVKGVVDKEFANVLGDRVHNRTRVVK